MEGDFESPPPATEKKEVREGQDWPVAPTSSERFRHVFDPKKIFSGRRPGGGVDIW